MYRKDLLGAFLQIPWDPMDAGLFGFSYEGMIFYFRMLVMGHRISPYLCQRITNSITYIHQSNGFFLLNYIDDFMGAEHEDKVERAYAALTQMLVDIGAQEAPDKAVRPT